MKSFWNCGIHRSYSLGPETRPIFGRQGKNSQIRDMAVQAGKMVNRDLNNTTLSENGENSRWKNN